MKSTWWFCLLGIVAGCSAPSAPPATPIIVTAKQASPVEGRDGRSEAKADIAAGKFSFKTYGCPLVGYQTFYRLLRERYGFVEDPLPYTDESVASFANAYNREMERAVEARFGRGIVGKTWSEARAIEEAEEGEANQAPQQQRP